MSLRDDCQKGFSRSPTAEMESQVSSVAREKSAAMTFVWMLLAASSSAATAWSFASVRLISTRLMPAWRQQATALTRAAATGHDHLGMRRLQSSVTVIPSSQRTVVPTVSFFISAASACYCWSCHWLVLGCAKLSRRMRLVALANSRIALSRMHNTFDQRAGQSLPGSIAPRFYCPEDFREDHTGAGDIRVAANLVGRLRVSNTCEHQWWDLPSVCARAVGINEIWRIVICSQHHAKTGKTEPQTMH